MTYREHMSKAAHDYLEQLLMHHDGNVTHAARAAELNRQGLHKLLTKYGLKEQAKCTRNASTAINAWLSQALQ